MKFAFKFSMPKWERPKEEAPYISNPLINELEKVDFASLTAERRQDILHRLKLACASIAEDRRRQPAILSDRIRLQKMWQDYFKIAQTTPAGDNLGENLSVSRYSEQEEEQKPRALGAVMTMQEELVAAANFKIDMGGLDINDMDDFDDFSLSSISRVAPPAPSTPPPPAPPPHAHAAGPLAAAAHRAASHHADTRHDTAPPHGPSVAEQELAEQMAQIKAVAPMALPPMAFPTEPVQEQPVMAAGPEAVFSIELSEDEAEPEISATKPSQSPDDELAEQMAKIKSVAPMNLPPMAFPSASTQEKAATAPEAETAFHIDISEVDQTENAVAQPVDAHDHDQELAEHMAKVKAIAPIALPSLPHPADRTGDHAQAINELRIEDHGTDDHPEIPQVIEEDMLHIQDEHLETLDPEGLAQQALTQEALTQQALTIDADVIEAETVTAVKAADQADENGFKPLSFAVIADAPATAEIIEAEIVEEESVEPEIAEFAEVAPAEAMTIEIPALTDVAPVVEQATDEPVKSVQIDPAEADPKPIEPLPAAQVAESVKVEEDQPAEPKPKRSRKASALATLRSMLSSQQAPEKSAPEEATSVTGEPGSQAPGVIADAPQPENPAIEAALPPKEREVSATPSTKEWVNIKLLRPSVIRGLPLPDQVITIVPYTEAKRLEENGSAIILTKPRTPRSSS